MPPDVRVDWPDPAATERWGRELGGLLRPGDFVGLIGTLGAGKTLLTRGIAAGWGVDPDEVTSPTFVLCQEYVNDAGETLFHLDAYRCRDLEEWEGLGVGEMQAQGLLIVEWADRVAATLPAERLEIEVAVLGDTRRQAQVSGHGKRGRDLVAAIG